MQRVNSHDFQRAGWPQVKRAAALSHRRRPGLAALRRAAIKARHRALQTTGSYPIWENGEIVYVTEIVGFSDEEIREVLGESAVTNIGGYVRPPKPM